MRITSKDREIYKYIEKNKFATVKQIANVFFNDIIYKNELAKKRLSCLVEHGQIKYSKAENCNQMVFYSEDKYKLQTYHNIVVMDLYTKFLEMRNLEVLNFEREKVWGSGKGAVRSDAFITVKYSGKIQNFLVEAQASKNLWINSITKYNNKVVLEEIYKACGGYAPVLIFMDEIMHSLDKVESFFQVRQIDLKLTDFPLIFDTE